MGYFATRHSIQSSGKNFKSFKICDKNRQKNLKIFIFLALFFLFKQKLIGFFKEPCESRPVMNFQAIAEEIESELLLKPKKR